VQVDDGPAQVRPEALRVTQVAEPTAQPHKGFLGQVLGLVVVPRQEIGEPDGTREVPDVQLVQLPEALLAPADRSHVRAHHPPTKTRDCAERYRS
jgi:hypothetical protein